MKNNNVAGNASLLTPAQSRAIWNHRLLSPVQQAAIEASFAHAGVQAPALPLSKSRTQKWTRWFPVTRIPWQVWAVVAIFYVLPFPWSAAAACIFYATVYRHLRHRG